MHYLLEGSLDLGFYIAEKQLLFISALGLPIDKSCFYASPIHFDGLLGKHIILQIMVIPRQSESDDSALWMPGVYS